MTTQQLIDKLTAWQNFHGVMEVMASEFLESSVGYGITDVCVVEEDDETKTLYLYNKWA